MQNSARAGQGFIAAVLACSSACAVFDACGEVARRQVYGVTRADQHFLERLHEHATGGVVRTRFRGPSYATSYHFRLINLCHPRSLLWRQVYS